MVFIEIKRMRWVIFGVSHFSENYQTRFQLFQSKAITSYSEFSTSKIVNLRLSTGKAPQKSAKRKKISKEVRQMIYQIGVYSIEPGFLT